MNATLECGCGTSLALDDASEVAHHWLVERWMAAHGGHTGPGPGRYANLPYPDEPS